MPANHVDGCACMACLMKRVQARRNLRRQIATTARPYIETPIHPRAKHHKHETGMLTYVVPHKPLTEKPYCYTCRVFYRAALYSAA
jgi:hypothetical protein